MDIYSKPAESIDGAYKIRKIKLYAHTAKFVIEKLKKYGYTENFISKSKKYKKT